MLAFFRIGLNTSGLFDTPQMATLRKRQRRQRKEQAKEQAESQYNEFSNANERVVLLLRHAHERHHLDPGRWPKPTGAWVSEYPHVL